MSHTHHSRTSRHRSPDDRRRERSHQDGDLRHRHSSHRSRERERSRDRHLKEHSREKYSREERQKDSWNFFGYTPHDLGSSSSKGISSNKEQVQEDLVKDAKHLTNNKNAEKKEIEIQQSEGVSGTSRKANADLDQDGFLPFLFDWKRHKSELDMLFFKSADSAIRKGTQAYDEFWVFLEKYLNFQAKQEMARVKGTDSKKSRTIASKDRSRKLDLPDQYDKRYKVNMSLVSPSKSVLDRYKYDRSGEGDKEDLTYEKVKEFRNILMYFLDFLQKQKFNKLVKLRKDQANLPIASFKDKIVDAVRKHSVVIVAGDTGCGKSTQVPQYLLSAGFTKIACTQPRRIACISLAKRVSFETFNEYGDKVGYQIRFESAKTSNTKILFLTEGLLLRQIQSDPLLQNYNVVVLDEVHERHLQGDFLLGVLRCILQQREDLKLILMSATINITLFSDYFASAPVIKVPGRLYPIQLQYVPVSEEEKQLRVEKIDPSPYLRIMQLIDHKYPSNERGDLLVFMSGIKEISTLVEVAKVYASQSERWIILALHSSLSVAEQDKVFDVAPEGVRKCIVSTNIAETSVTIDGVRFIVDSGKVKEMSYIAQAKMQQLQEFWISQASAEQRKGRAGRTGPGVCYRLYDESDYDAFQEYSTPEIQRVPLDSLILQMLSMGLKDPRNFPFIEPPPVASMETSITFLKELGAIDSEEALTSVGSMLAQLPVDVVIGKMLIMGTVFQMIDPVLSIAACLSVQSPYTNKAYRNTDAVGARKPLESDHGDPFTLLNAFGKWIQIKADKHSSSRKWCKRLCFEEQRFYEMSKLKRQFKDLLKDHNMLERSRDERDRPYSSTERQRRGQDRRRLQALKRKQKGNKRKKKILKLEHEDIELSDEDSNDDEVDIADIEFKLTHDMDRLEAVVHENQSFTLRELNILKVILCSGLYPQLAIADDCNSYQKESDQVFHTKAKPFVLIHPNSVFAYDPEPLRPPEPKDDTEVQGGSSKGPMSNKHQLLAYVSLLETTKPYLVNTMRVPALQTVLVYARSLDTNSDCTRIIADDWLEFTFADSDSAEEMISAALQLRSVWNSLLEMRLKESQMKVSGSAASLEVVHQERLLASKLAEFLDSDVEYTMKRLSSLDLQNLYIGPNTAISEDSFFTKQTKDSNPHPIKGGCQVNDFFIYGCLLDGTAEYTSVLRKHWTCPSCDASFVITTLEKLQHEADCHQKQNSENPEVADEKKTTQSSAGMEALKRLYHCPICGEEFSFSSVEILKHKRSHAAAKS